MYNKGTPSWKIYLKGTLSWKKYLKGTLMKNTIKECVTKTHIKGDNWKILQFRMIQSQMFAVCTCCAAYLLIHKTANWGWDAGVRFWEFFGGLSFISHHLWLISCNLPTFQIRDPTVEGQSLPYPNLRYFWCF
jgi:hypothetical protein